MDKKDFRFLQSTPWTPIKIYVDYTYLNSQKTFDASTIAIFKEVIKNTIKVFTSILNVQSVNPILKINQECADVPLNQISVDLQKMNNSRYSNFSIF